MRLVQIDTVAELAPVGTRDPSVGSSASAPSLAYVWSRTARAQVMAQSAALPERRSTSRCPYFSRLNRYVPWKMMCEKCTGPIRRSQSSSIGKPEALRRETTPSMRLVFQASTMFVRRACALEMAIISCLRRPRSCAICPPWIARWS